MKMREFLIKVFDLSSSGVPSSIYDNNSNSLAVAYAASAPVQRVRSDVRADPCWCVHV